MNQEIRDAAANVLTCEANIKRLDLQMELAKGAGGPPCECWELCQERTSWYMELQDARLELVEAVMESLDLRLTVESVVEAQLEAFGLTATVETAPGFAATADIDFVNELLDEEFRDK